MVINAVRETSKAIAIKQNAPSSSPSIWIIEALTTNDVVHHGINKLLCAATTPFQQMAVADIGPYGRALILDGRMQTTTGDEYLYHEPIVHVPCILHGAPVNVLILGGADAGAARVALQWKSIKNLVMVDIDGQVIEACKEFLPSIHAGCHSDPRLHVLVENAVDYVDRVTETFDVIIADITDPLEHGPSYELFTQEFFAKAKRRLVPGGFLVVQAGTISLVEEPTLHARVCKTVSSVFANTTTFVSFIPSYATPLGFCVASDAPLASPGDIPIHEIDKILEESVTGEVRAMDGVFFRGLFSNIPKTVRQVVATETVVFTASTRSGKKKKNVPKKKLSKPDPAAEQSSNTTLDTQDDAPAPQPPPTSLWVSRYPAQLVGDDLKSKLREEFGQYGTVKSVVAHGSYTFVEMASSDEVHRAVQAWSHKPVGDSGSFKDCPLLVRARVQNRPKPKPRGGGQPGRGRRRAGPNGQRRHDDAPAGAGAAAASVEEANAAASSAAAASHTPAADPVPQTAAADPVPQTAAADPVPQTAAAAPAAAEG